jgi:hypothetical protein
MTINANLQSQEIDARVLHNEVVELQKHSKNCPTLMAVLNDLKKMLADVKGQAAPAAKATSTSESNSGHRKFHHRQRPG